MSFLVIIAVVAFILAIANRASRKDPYILRDNDNTHLFDNSDGFIQNKSINKQDLIEGFKKSYEMKNFFETKNRILYYLKYYNEDSFVNFLLVISLVELKEYEEAEKYANNVLYMLDNNKRGYYLLGYLEFAKGNMEKSLDYMESAMHNGLPKNAIESTIHDKIYLDRLFNKNSRNTDFENDELPF